MNDMHPTQDTIMEDVTDTILTTGTNQQHQNQTRPNSLQLHQHQSNQHSQATTIHLNLQTKVTTHVATEEVAGAGKTPSFLFTNLEVILVWCGLDGASCFWDHYA